MATWIGTVGAPEGSGVMNGQIVDTKGDPVPGAMWVLYDEAGKELARSSNRQDLDNYNKQNVTTSTDASGTQTATVSPNPTPTQYQIEQTQAQIDRMPGTPTNTRPPETLDLIPLQKKLQESEQTLRVFDPLVQSGQFVGTESQYQKYQNAYGEYNTYATLYSQRANTAVSRIEKAPSKPEDVAYVQQLGGMGIINKDAVTSYETVYKSNVEQESAIKQFNASPTFETYFEIAKTGIFSRNPDLQSGMWDTATKNQQTGYALETFNKAPTRETAFTMQKTGYINDQTYAEMVDIAGKNALAQESVSKFNASPTVETANKLFASGAIDLKTKDEMATIAQQNTTANLEQQEILKTMAGAGFSDEAIYKGAQAGWFTKYPDLMPVVINAGKEQKLATGIMALPTGQAYLESAEAYKSGRISKPVFESMQQGIMGKAYFEAIPETPSQEGVAIATKAAGLGALSQESLLDYTQAAAWNSDMSDVRNIQVNMGISGDTVSFEAGDIWGGKGSEGQLQLKESGTASLSYLKGKGITPEDWVKSSVYASSRFGISPNDIVTFNGKSWQESSFTPEQIGERTKYQAEVMQYNKNIKAENEFWKGQSLFELTHVGSTGGYENIKASEITAKNAYYEPAKASLGIVGIGAFKASEAGYYEAGKQIILPETKTFDVTPYKPSSEFAGDIIRNASGINTPYNPITISATAITANQQQDFENAIFSQPKDTPGRTTSQITLAKDAYAQKSTLGKAGMLITGSFIDPVGIGGNYLDYKLFGAEPDAYQTAIYNTLIKPSRNVEFLGQNFVVPSNEVLTSVGIGLATIPLMGGAFKIGSVAIKSVLGSGAQIASKVGAPIVPKVLSGAAKHTETGLMIGGLGLIGYDVFKSKTKGEALAKVGYLAATLPLAGAGYKVTEKALNKLPAISFGKPKGVLIESEPVYASVDLTANRLSLGSAKVDHSNLLTAGKTEAKSYNLLSGKTTKTGNIKPIDMASKDKSAIFGSTEKGLTTLYYKPTMQEFAQMKKSITFETTGTAKTPTGSYQILKVARKIETPKPEGKPIDQRITQTKYSQIGESVTSTPARSINWRNIVRIEPKKDMQPVDVKITPAGEHKALNAINWDIDVQGGIKGYNLNLRTKPTTPGTPKGIQPTDSVPQIKTEPFIQITGSQTYLPKPKIKLPFSLSDKMPITPAWPNYFKDTGVLSTSSGAQPQAGVITATRPIVLSSLSNLDIETKKSISTYQGHSQPSVFEPVTNKTFKPSYKETPTSNKMTGIPQRQRITTTPKKPKLQTIDRPVVLDSIKNLTVTPDKTFTPGKTTTTRKADNWKPTGITGGTAKSNTPTGTRLNIHVNKPTSSTITGKPKDKDKYVFVPIRTPKKDSPATPSFNIFGSNSPKDTTITNFNFDNAFDSPSPKNNPKPNPLFNPAPYPTPKPNTPYKTEFLYKPSSPSSRGYRPRIPIPPKLKLKSGTTNLKYKKGGRSQQGTKSFKEITGVLTPGAMIRGLPQKKTKTILKTQKKSKSSILKKRKRR